MLIKSILFASFLCFSSYGANTKIVAVVGDHVLTDYDLDQKIRFTMFSQGMEMKSFEKEAMYPYFINSIIDNDMIVSAIKKNGGNIPDSDLQNGLKYMAMQRKITSDQLIKIATDKYGMDRDYFMNCVKDEMVMQIMFLGPLSNEVKVSDSDIQSEALNRKVDPENTAAMEEIRSFLIQKNVMQQVRQTTQSLRQRTFVEIKLR